MNHDCYLTREDSILALKKMKKFHDECQLLYERHGFDLLDNLGRRNILMSQAQEKFFAESLSEKFMNVKNDGHTGEPDIFIGELDKELECKLTSRTKSGAISFQTDYSTLQDKKSLDYLYVVASENFDEFAVVHYRGLTVEEFRPPAAGSRGKSQLIKHKAADKGNILLGSMISVNNREIQKLKRKLEKTKTTQKSIRKKLLKSLEFWESTPTKYTFKLESVNE